MSNTEYPHTVSEAVYGDGPVQSSINFIRNRREQAFTRAALYSAFASANFAGGIVAGEGNFRTFEFGAASALGVIALGHAIGGFWLDVQSDKLDKIA